MVLILTGFFCEKPNICFLKEFQKFISILPKISLRGLINISLKYSIQLLF